MSYTLSDYTVGRKALVGGELGTVATIGRKYVHITVNGKTRPYLPEAAKPCHPGAVMPKVKPQRTWTSPQTLRTTRVYPSAAPSQTLNAKQRRALRNGASRYSLSVAS